MAAQKTGKVRLAVVGTLIEAMVALALAAKQVEQVALALVEETAIAALAVVVQQNRYLALEASEVVVLAAVDTAPAWEVAADMVVEGSAELVIALVVVVENQMNQMRASFQAAPAFVGVAERYYSYCSNLA